jgi:hypothetical protein
MLTRLILLTVIWLAACTPIPAQRLDSQSVATTKPDSSSPMETTIPEVQPTVAETIDVVSRTIVEKARADLMKRLNLAAEQIRLAEVRPMNWPDSSLGCPQPDMAYSQVLTPGYWILLEADGRQYHYHADEADQLIFCPQDSSDRGPDGEPLPVLPVNPNEIDDGEPWVPVN